MDYEARTFIVYVRVDNENRIVAVDSSAFLPDPSGWVEIDSGYGDKYHHAQGNYFPKPKFDERGIHRYMTAPVSDDPDREAYRTYEYEGEIWGVYERTQEEMDGDYVEPVPTPSDAERIAALESAMTAIEEGIASV